MARRFVRCLLPPESDNARQFFSACRFLSSSKRLRSELPSKPRPSSKPPAVLIDAFVNRAKLRQTEISDDLLRQGWACVDNFMGADVCNSMRLEADTLMKVTTTTTFCAHVTLSRPSPLQSGAMKTSKSTKWDASTGYHVTYDKHNVLSTEMLGGEM